MLFTFKLEGKIISFPLNWKKVQDDQVYVWMEDCLDELYFSEEIKNALDISWAKKKNVNISLNFLNHQKMMKICLKQKYFH